MEIGKSKLGREDFNAEFAKSAEDAEKNREKRVCGVRA
jgi:hypothetical protein